MLDTSRLPSPLGEKYCVRFTVMTGAALLSRWATKNAANVAPTSATNVMRAMSGIAPAGLLGALVLPKDHDHVPVLLRDVRSGERGLDRVVDRGGLLDPQGRSDHARGPLGLRPVHDHRGLGLVRLREGADLGVGLRIALADELVPVVGRQPADTGAVEDEHPRVGLLD